MNAGAFRHFYEYHFSENRSIWDNNISQLTDVQFTQGANYSHGSVRDQIVHLINVDAAWFSSLRGVEFSEPLNPVETINRQSIRAYWDNVEQEMRDYLAGLRDNMLFEKPIKEPEEDKDLILWQVLLHVVNHGTDHRAQLLRLLNDFGVKTTSQDYVFFIEDNPI